MRIFRTHSKRWSSLACLMVGLSATAQSDEAEKTDPAANTGSADAQQVETSDKLPAYVGFNVIAQVEDVRETTGDLIAALENAAETYGYADLKEAKNNLKTYQSKLDNLEAKIDRKRDLADDSAWFGYVNTPAYGVTVHETVGELGKVLKDIASDMEGGTKTTQQMPIRFADDVVDQVDDVRDTVADLVRAVSDSGNRFYHYNWDRDQKKLSDYDSQLEAMEERLDRKELAANEEWTAWFGADVYKVSVHDSVDQLGSILEGLSESFSSADMAKAAE